MSSFTSIIQSIVLVVVSSLYYANLQHNWATEMIGVDAAFLNAEVDQDIFIEIPEGLCELVQSLDEYFFGHFD